MTVASPAPHPLPAHLEGEALEALHAQLQALRGADLDMDGAAVVRLNGLGLQLLLSAFAAWREDGRRLRLIDPSPVLAEAFARLDLAADGAGAGAGAAA